MYVNNLNSNYGKQKYSVRILFFTVVFLIFIYFKVFCGLFKLLLPSTKLLYYFSRT